ncbi:PD-(D/E)XK nuclease family protein [Prosthecobacter fusiformis]|uniref:PD-(D/E)XK nuclease family protein n=1 Tax=Prosthecobacter fusiformis TaxID=48464 RepID=UPI0014153070|nr:PD-(D/E)XK nuclease family protein [Prosthecobacter fusiformis]
MNRHFWGWDAPVLKNAVRHLMHGYSGPAALDLTDTLLIVSTAEAGRRLKEALARAHAPGALVPWVWTAEQALLPAAVRKEAATRLQSQMAWQQALQKVAVEKLTALFPVLPEERGWTWQLELARVLDDLNSLLGAGGLTFADVAMQSTHDAARWHDLAIIEDAYTQELNLAGLCDAQALKLRTAIQPVLPEDIKRVIVLAAPDLPPLFQRWLLGCAAEVTVAIQAPQEMEHTFDEIGRPLPGYWGENADVMVPLPDAHMHLHHDASTQAERTITLLRELAPKARVAVGVGDPEVGAVLQEKLALENVRVFEPGGVSPTEVGLWHVLNQMRALLAGSTWKAFAVLLRVPEVRAAWMGGGQNGGLKVLKEADDFAMEHMPVTLEHALELSARAEPGSLLPTVLVAARTFVQELKSLPLTLTARTLLTQLYGERKFSPNTPSDQLTTSLADAWLGCCREIEAELARFGLTPKPEEIFALSLEALARTALTEPRGEIDLVLQGWLELLWEPAPNLVVAGLNEEHVPGILIAHPFLPDQVRQQLSLPSQATRFARDAYTLAALAAQRLHHGALHVLCGQWSERGDALRPSRLLFLCDDETLPQRVKHLFPKEESGSMRAQEPARTLAWQLRPRIRLPKVEFISPSRIRSYLECPFRDYLSQELRMEAIDASKRELAPSEFGTLAHHALQKLAEHPQMKASKDAKEIADFLVGMAMEQAHLRYGRKPAPLIRLQLESLKQRLTHAADTEAAERENGWAIYASEWSPGEKPLIIEGALLKCKVDRIDRHEHSGQFRVLDFKTADKITDPLAAHVRKVTGRTHIAEPDEWKCFQLSDGSSYQWKDLQLPLYAAALREHGLRPDAVGYFTLPKNVQDTKVLTWSGFSDEWADRALECAAEVVRRLREGRFWPPSPKAYDRGFDELFLGDLTAATLWEGPTV